MLVFFVRIGLCCRPWMPAPQPPRWASSPRWGGRRLGRRPCGAPGAPACRACPLPRAPPRFWTWIGALLARLGGAPHVSSGDACTALLWDQLLQVPRCCVLLPALYSTAVMPPTLHPPMCSYDANGERSTQEGPTPLLRHHLLGLTPPAAAAAGTSGGPRGAGAAGAAVTPAEVRALREEVASLRLQVGL